MTDFKFTPDMFRIGPYSTRAHEISDFCNIKLQEWLRAAPVVYGKLQDSSGYGFAFTTTRGPQDTQCARLVCIEELR